MKRLITAIAAAVAFAFMPQDAAAQFSTQATTACESPTTCEVCNFGFTGDHKATYDGGSYAGKHDWCLDGWDCSGHPRCDVADNAPLEEQMKYERLKQILSNYEGEDRVASLVEEFPGSVRLTSNALEVEGMLCEEGKLIGRLTMTEKQAERYGGEQLAGA